MKVWTVPNILTFMRLLMVGVFIALMEKGHLAWALAIFLLAGVTDLLDGAIARKYDLSTPLGAVLDPLADKLMLISAMVCLYRAGTLPLWVLVIVLCKETTMIIAGCIFYKKKLIQPATLPGKVATAMFTIGIVLTFLSEWVHPWNEVVLFAAIVVSIVALIRYAGLFLEKLRARKNQGTEEIRDIKDASR